MVAVDPDLGTVEILDYVIVEDGGTLVNPMVVDGQIYGGLAQGIGTALYEEMRFDTRGQPLASTFADYLLPGASRGADGPHRPHGDALALHALRPEGHRRGRRHRAPGGIANAVNDALARLGVEMLHAPLTPRRIVAAVLAARPALPERRRRREACMKPAPFAYERPGQTSRAPGRLAAGAGQSWPS